MIPQKTVVIHSLSTGLLLDSVQDLGDLVIKASALFHQIRDLLVGIHNRGVVSVAKKLPDFRKGQVGLLADQVHGDLPSLGHSLLAGRAK